MMNMGEKEKKNEKSYKNLKIGIDKRVEFWYSIKAVCDTRCSRKFSLKKEKISLDNVNDQQYNKPVPHRWRHWWTGSVPCKLNNERESTRRDARKCELKV